jgi:hypothetical protein
MIDFSSYQYSQWRINPVWLAVPARLTPEAPVLSGFFPVYGYSWAR